MTNREPVARLDLERTERINLPEAVYCAGKTTDQAVDIVDQLLQAEADAVIATRLTEEQRQILTGWQPSLVGATTLAWNPRPPTGHKVAVIAAGTSDLTVAEECSVTLRALGHTTDSITDVGVAGLHRLTAVLPQIETAEVVIAIAGMEGALPTVLAGLISLPIIAVPTSVGYGTALQGITALLSMLTSCAPGVAVVGIDNGYGAACAAHRILGSRQ